MAKYEIDIPEDRVEAVKTAISTVVAGVELKKVEEKTE